METSNMETLVIKAIAEVNLNDLERLLKINDFLHKGAPEFEGFKQSEMLTDMKYEEALQFLREQRALEVSIYAKTSTDDVSSSRKANENTLMFMDGIQIVDTIPALKHVLLFPKFDGCSVGAEIIKSNDSFLITKAHTRGTDNLDGTRKCQDKTAYIQEVSKEMMERFNTIITDEKKDLHFELHYKNTSLLGNENRSMKTIIDLHNIDYMLIRGEFVCKDKSLIGKDDLPSTAVGLAAGALNAKEERFNELKQYIDYIPFEIALIKVLANGKIVDYIPTQDSAYKIMLTLNMITYKAVKLSEINENYNMENTLSAYEQDIKQPLDGIVYCRRNWTYPSLVEETSKRVNYGKYKWKRHNVKQTKLRAIEYSIGKTGKLTPSFIFDGVSINGKTYKQAKTTFNHIQEYTDKCIQENKQFGNGLICELELMSDISPQITRIFPAISKIKETIKPLVKCPYCNGDLTIENKIVSKQRVINAICDNPKCLGVLSQKCCDFLKQIGYKGISYKTLENMKYKHFADLYNAKLITEYRDVAKKEKIIYSANSVKKQLNKQNSKQNFDDIMKTLTIKNFLISTSLFTKAKVGSFINSMKLNEMDNLIENIGTDKYKEFVDYLRTKTSYFIKDLTTFIISHYVINADE